jgi:hypothetical protein
MLVSLDATKAIIAATVLAEVSTPDPLSLSTKDHLNEEIKTKRHIDKEQDEDKESVSVAVSAASAQHSLAASVSHNLDMNVRSIGGRFLKRSESGINWIEVTTAEAMEKASHALRGLPRRSEVGSLRSSASSTSLATTTASVRASAMSSPFASLSSTVLSSTREKHVIETFEGQETRQAKKTKRQSKSDPKQQAHSNTIATAAASAEIEATAAAALQTLSSPPQGNGYSSAIQNTLDSLTGAPFPSILQNALAPRSYLSPEQFGFSFMQQHELQLQLQQYLAAQHHQQQQEHQARIEQFHQEIQRQIVVEIMAQQLVQQEQEQLQAQQRHLLNEQAMQRQMLLHQQQLRYSAAVPTHYHHLLPNALPPHRVSHVSSNIASILQGNIASQQHQQQRQHQQNLMLQQLLMMTAASDMQRVHDRGEGEEEDAKPPAR